PFAKHPFRVGHEVAVRAGYPEEVLATIPAASVNAFAGVSCVPCFAEIPPGARVLDLGCGAGLDSLLVAARAGSVLAIDFSRTMLAVARTSAETMGLANVEFREGDAESIPAATGSIDIALVNGIFNLNPARAAIFEEMARVTRRGGLLFAAELVLKRPLPPEVTPSESDWFA
ncbi:MAG TPA: methyltransferase domain-containing protein, partial [Candidatus Dormibacteraeota bacterium]|nr:methyltransferase domain-containing protein [Candidatus Dormibacteraeota bacterium]